MRSDGWLGVELRHLAALQAVAEEASFGRAAERLGYTQSAVSQQIQALERIVGQRLVERPGGPRRVSLTEAGELLLRHAAGIVARLQAAQADLAAFSEGSAGTLRVGTFQSVGARILPETMRRFLAAWPRVEIQLTESPADDELLRLVERGELDVTFAMLPLAEGPFALQELLRDSYVLLVPAGHELADRASASLADLGDLPLIGNRACRSTSLAESELGLRGVEVAVSFRSDDNGTVQGLVGSGFGAALVPLLTVDVNDDRVRVLELEPEIPQRQIALAWHGDRHRSPAALAFLDVAAEVCADLRLGLPQPA
jgi:DNA-binding transcriptional LysR family regulator